MKKKSLSKHKGCLNPNQASEDSFKIPFIVLDTPKIIAKWIKDQNLVFANGNTAFDPKVGIPLYGPMSYQTGRHRKEVHIGIIATSQIQEDVTNYYDKLACGVDGSDQLLPFPGCKEDRGYRMKISFDATLVENFSRSEHQEILGIRNTKDRFERIVFFYEQKIRLLSEKDHPIDNIIVAIPDDIYKKCRVAEYKNNQNVFVLHNLRRVIKAIAMKYKVPTQILQESTINLNFRRDREHLSVIAWNLFTGLYFKTDGLPWGPSGITPGTCYIGISFFRPLDDRSKIRTSVAQAFDENGEGLVLRGKSFQWDEEKQGRSPHLSEELAGELISQIIKRYCEERKQNPKKIVIHKTSRFEQDERLGFESVLKTYNCLYDLVALEQTSMCRLVRKGKYPPLRGTCFSIGELDYLYTTGFISATGKFPQGHVPSPLQIADHVGDSSTLELFRDIMMLTKMNWNSANVDGALPITLLFARAVGDVMREIPAGQEPNPKYKFYI
ncbi:hypothetical protein FACS189427_07850 [Planctomycetales bacterium]|nr:hypothetical protein FACS189427_07850 [Planctomycetales bacterium]